MRCDLEHARSNQWRCTGSMFSVDMPTPRSSATCSFVSLLLSATRTASLRNSSVRFSPIVHLLCCNKCYQRSGIQRVYTDDLQLDETMAVQSHDVVCDPRGHHPCGAPHGFEMYYLNVMAGPKRAWRFVPAPNVKHLMT
ncbi:MAG: hypothetical protein ACJAR9_001855 [Celeribacter sp.]|jgi:hypothetical protein